MSETNGSHFYNGSQLFAFLAEYLGQPLDQVNFVLAQLFALLFGIFFNKVLSYRKVSVDVRHYSSLTVGILIGYFFVGKELIHLFVLTTITYLSLLIFSPKIVQKVVLMIALTHLLYLHLIRYLDNPGFDNGYTMDITAPMMVAVQRVTDVAFSLHDGSAKSEEKLTPDQKTYALKKRPTVLEFFSYLFQFPSLLCGPLVFYKDYIEFISGENIEKHFKHNSNKTEIPFPLWPVLKKLFVSIMFAILHIIVNPYFPISTLKEDKYLYEMSFLWKNVYLYAVMLVARFKYYHAFLLSEVVCNASGLGFGGFTPDGRQDWGFVNNMDIIEFENSLTIRTAFESWNKKTQVWLRRTAYDRNERYKLLWVYLLSSVWHGIYPGYYLALFQFAFFTIASRTVRRCLRPRLQGKGRGVAFAYDCVTYLSSRVILSYMIIPFNLLEFWTSLQVYKQLYFFGHILGLMAIFILPRVLTSKGKPVDSIKTHQN